MATQRALLLIADISGYTRFMKVHRINLAHAQDIVARLLEAVIDGAGRRFRLSKLEGDAALFYATLSGRDEARLRDLGQAIAAIQTSFVARREQMRIDRLCSCDGCVQVGELKLKFVIHAGEVAFQRVKSFTELAGLDVILVHRMLKNSVPLSEYVLMSPPVLEGVDEALRSQAQEIEEDLEGIGKMPFHYVDLGALLAVLPEPPRPSLLRALWEHIKMNARSLPYFLGIRKACNAFRNMDAAVGGETALLGAPEAGR